MRSKETGRRACLLLVPALFLVIGVRADGLREPFYLWADPDYTYLLSALCITEGAVPAHTDHPGTPLQLMGALLLHARHLAGGRPHGSLREHVLREPELFLAFWRAALRALYLLALAAGGALVLRVTRSLACALLFQATPLFSMPIVLALSPVAAEPALLVLGTALSALTLAAVVEPDRFAGARAAAALGALAGLGVATKVVFAPVALVPLAALDGRRRRVFAVAGAITLTLALLPIATRLPGTAKFYARIATHTRMYGGGPVGLVDATRLPGHVAMLVREEWLTVGTMLAAVAVALAACRARTEETTAARVLVATAALQAGWLAVTLRHFDARYLVPAALLGGPQAALAWRTASGLPPSARRASRAALVALLCAAAALAPARWLGTVGRLEQDGAERAEAARFIARSPPLIEDGYRLSQAAALQHGNVYANARFSADLRRLHPGFVSWGADGLQAFGQPLPLLRPLLHAEPDGRLALLAMVPDGSPALRTPPAGLALIVRRRFGDQALYEARLPPCVPSEGAFAGFLESGGLRYLEGPYPQWGLERPVRWGLQPETTLLFAGGSESMTLEMSARHHLPEARRVRVWLNGALVERVELPASQAFQDRVVRFQPRPGFNELRLQYGPRGAASGEATPTVLYERLRLSCAGPLAP
jgi:hypothetical protein